MTKTSPKIKARLSKIVFFTRTRITYIFEITENEEELDSLREAIYYEDSKVERNLENIPNTIEWLTTWRKIVS